MTTRSLPHRGGLKSSASLSDLARLRGRRVDASEHHALAAGLVGGNARRVGGVAHLHEERGAGFVADVYARAVDGQVAEEEYVAGPGGARNGRFEGILVEGQVPPSALLVRQRPELV